jgi:hypothetical protein
METPRGMQPARVSREGASGPGRAAAFPAIVKASALGLGGAVRAERPDRHGRHRVRHAGARRTCGRSWGRDEVQWVAVCDLDDMPAERGAAIVNEQYGNEDCATYKDYRELFARGDLDAVSIAVPDHWHAILSIEAVRAGLDVFGEKPFTHSLREGRALCDAVKRYGRVWQTGSWQRSEDNFHRACELVRNGRIGRILRVEVGLPSGYTDFARTFGQEKIESPAAGARLRDVDRPGAVGALLQGARPHELALEHGLRRRPADGLGRPPPRHRALGTRLRLTGPVEVSGKGEFPTSESTTPPRVTGWKPCTPTARRSSWPAATPRSRAGRSGSANSAGCGSTAAGFESQPAHLVHEVIGPNETRLYRSRDH